MGRTGGQDAQIVTRPPFSSTTRRRDSTFLAQKFCPQCLPQVKHILLPGEVASPLRVGMSVSWAFNRLTGKGQCKLPTVHVGWEAEPTPQARGKGPASMPKVFAPDTKPSAHTEAPCSILLTLAVGLPSQLQAFCIQPYFPSPTMTRNVRVVIAKARHTKSPRRTRYQSQASVRLLREQLTPRTQTLKLLVPVRKS